ncbi:hypothetical protein HK098_007663 [Nowakowskiella sp. JEL0407]|nr:hypothetical protein HK098_007663 [Nowakowskiella sp. JEL0407]
MSEIPAIASRPRTFHHPIHHSQFAKQDKESQNIPAYVKHCIIEESPARLQFYEPQKVFIRTDQRLASKDFRQIAFEKSSRREDVYKRGFCSDPKEVYKPLGEPQLDSETLLYSSLKISPAQKRTANHKVTDDANPGNASNIDVKLKIGTPQRNPNGFSILKSKLSQSKARLNAVRFGIPFMDICDIDTLSRIPRFDNERQIVRCDGSEFSIDWSNLKIDTDKQTYYMNLYEASKAKQKDVKDKKKEVDQTSDSLRATTTSSTKGVRVGLPYIASPTKMDTKELEGALDVHPNPHLPISKHSFFESRNQFYNIKHRLNQILQDDLNRMDYDRKTSFERKFLKFQIRKNAMFGDDIAKMRKSADAQKRKEKQKILENHPWYFDLINKIVAVNGKKPAYSAEEMLISRIRGIIEDHIPFTKGTFVHLLKVVPASDLNKDDVQRIIRFVKQREGISERDYVEAMDLAMRQ